MKRHQLVFFLILFFPLPVFAHGGAYSAAATTKTGNGEKGISSAPMINSPVATTQGKNHASLGFSYAYVNYNTIPVADAHRLHDSGRDVHGKNHEEAYVFDAGYGILEDLDVNLTAPVVAKNSIDIESHGALQGNREYAKGFGDMELLGKYRFWKRDVEAAILAGIKFPTGRTNEKRRSGMKFASEQQAGSGSWDADFGLAVSRSFRNRISTATSFLYELKTEGAQGEEQGDGFHYNLAVSYALRQFGKYPNLSFVAELNQEWERKDKSREEARVFDSGGYSLFVTPGFTADLNPNVSAFAGMPLPVYQNLGGEHEEVQLEVIAGISVSV